MSTEQANYVVTAYYSSEDPTWAPEPKERGSLGPGYYFTLVKRQAADIGRVVTDCTVTLSNPWMIKAEYESDMANELEFDNPCIEAICTLPGGEQLVQEQVARVNEFAYFGQELQSLLISLGYDGIVAEYAEDCHHVIAFKPSQFDVHGIVAMAKA